MMTGIFSAETPEKCNHYARFMQRLERHDADIIFWVLFVFMIMLLITASTMYTKASKTLTDLENSPVDASHHRDVRVKCFFISLFCFALAVAAAIVEAFAGFNIQFCDGEDLMMLYWGFWSLIQVGSVIAIFGIALNQWYSLRERELPPWNVALGTPVLVIAALGHVWHGYTRSLWRKFRGREENDMSTRSASADCPSMSRAPTISPHPDARHVGYSLTHEPLFAYPKSEGVSPKPLAA